VPKHVAKQSSTTGISAGAKKGSLTGVVNRGSTVKSGSIDVLPLLTVDALFTAPVEDHFLAPAVVPVVLVCLASSGLVAIRG
jgi:hypothetical protein